MGVCDMECVMWIWECEMWVVWRRYGGEGGD